MIRWRKIVQEGEIMSTVEQEVLPLVAGDRLTRDDFLRRWEAMPNVKFAELIGGIVYTTRGW
jgi:hypothetical protein